MELPSGSDSENDSRSGETFDDPMNDSDEIIFWGTVTDHERELWVARNLFRKSTDLPSSDRSNPGHPGTSHNAISEIPQTAVDDVDEMRDEEAAGGTLAPPSTPETIVEDHTGPRVRRLASRTLMNTFQEDSGTETDQLYPHDSRSIRASRMNDLLLKSTSVILSESRDSDIYKLQPVPDLIRKFESCISSPILTNASAITTSISDSPMLPYKPTSINKHLLKEESFRTLRISKSARDGPDEANLIFRCPEDIVKDDCVITEVIPSVQNMCADNCIDLGYIEHTQDTVHASPKDIIETDIDSDKSPALIVIPETPDSVDEEVVCELSASSYVDTPDSASGENILELFVSRQDEQELETASNSVVHSLVFESSPSPLAPASHVNVRCRKSKYSQFIEPSDEVEVTSREPQVATNSCMRIDESPTILQVINKSCQEVTSSNCGIDLKELPGLNDYNTSILTVMNDHLCGSSENEVTKDTILEIDDSFCNDSILNADDVDSDKENIDDHGRDMLLLTLQRRFDKHCKSAISDLSLNNTYTLGGTSGENDSILVSEMSSFLADEAACQSLFLKETSVSCDRDLSNDSFVEGQASSSRLEEDDSVVFASGGFAMNLSGVSKLQDTLATGNVSTVSADADGGFLNTLTDLAILHATMHNKETEPTASQSCVEEYVDTKDDANSSVVSERFNDTIEEMELLEMFGKEYMCSGKDESFSKRKKEVSMRNESAFSVDQSFSREQPFASKTCIKNEKCFSNVSSVDLETEVKQNFVATATDMQTKDWANVISENISVNHINQSSAEDIVKDFHFPKPMSTVKLARPKYVHEVTPMKVPDGQLKCTNNNKGKFFGHLFSKTPEHVKVVSRAVVSADMKRGLNVPMSNKTKYFNNIESPIGAYINNTPSPSLVVNVKSPQVGIKHKSYVKNKKLFPELLSLGEKNANLRGSENVAPKNLRSPLPRIVYKSASSLKVAEPNYSNLPHLDEKMKRLVGGPMPLVSKHTGRVKASQIPSNSPISHHVPSRLTQPDDSCFVGDATQEAEISVVVCKKAYRTNTLGH